MDMGTLNQFGNYQGQISNGFMNQVNAQQYMGQQYREMQNQGLQNIFAQSNLNAYRNMQPAPGLGSLREVIKTEENWDWNINGPKTNEQWLDDKISSIMVML